VKVVLILTILALAPALLMTVTSFTRILIVLSFVRRALSIPELPPNPVLIGPRSSSPSSS
jgi:flagellar biosynthetic protein FliP